MDGMISAKMLAYFADWRKGGRTPLVTGYWLAGLHRNRSALPKLYRQLALPEEPGSYQDFGLRLQHSYGQASAKPPYFCRK